MFTNVFYPTELIHSYRNMELQRNVPRTSLLSTPSRLIFIALCFQQEHKGNYYDINTVNILSGSSYIRTKRSRHITKQRNVNKQVIFRKGNTESRTGYCAPNIYLFGMLKPDGKYFQMKFAAWNEQKGPEIYTQF